MRSTARGIANFIPFENSNLNMINRSFQLSKEGLAQVPNRKLSDGKHDYS